MNLVIDIGNTLVKAALFKNNKLVARLDFSFDENAFKSIKSFLAKADYCIISSVAKNSKAFEKQITLALKNTVVLNSKTQLPFINKYKTRESLGPDRIANAAAAACLFRNKNVLAIDAGTCLKFDFVNNKGHYLGGSISPGLAMRFKSLQTFTGKLPLIEAKQQKALIGNSTESSIRSGVQTGMAEEIKGVINLYGSKFNDLNIILTGGDCRFFANQLKTHIFARPDFTLQGLNEILKYNF